MVHLLSSPYPRQACVERIKIGDQGHIKQVPVTSMGFMTAVGGTSADALPAKGNYNAHYACNLIGPKGTASLVRATGIREANPYYDEYVADDGQPGHCIAHIERGTVIGFKYFDFKKTKQTIHLALRGHGSGRILFSSDEEGTVVLGEMTVELNSQGWLWLPCELATTLGKKGLYIHMNTDGVVDFGGLQFMEEYIDRDLLGGNDEQIV